MSGTTPVIYPVDYTGTAVTNAISNEVITLTAQQIRAFSPLYAPFFKKNIRIVDTVTGLVLTTSQFKAYNLVSAPSAIASVGNEVYAVVIVTDAAVSNSLLVSYQTVGGSYTTGYETIISLINNLLSSNQVANTDPVSWSSVQNLPVGFPENLHLHSVGDTVGWEFVASQLEQVRLAIMLGDQVNKDFVLSYIASAITAANTAAATLSAPGTPFGNHVGNQNNPHSITAATLGLGNVQNYNVATLPQAYAGTASNLYVTVDQVASVVQNQINLGMDSHVVNYNNPHQLSANQLGLGNLSNYGVATLNDLNNPVNGTNLYVTNTVLSQYLNQYFSNQNSTTAGSLGSVTAQANAALTAAQAAQTAALAAQTTANTATLAISAAVATANTALAAANQNAVDAQNSTSSATTLLQTYVVSAVAAAQSAYYARGYADGVASVA